MSDVSRHREETEGFDAPQLISWALARFGPERIALASSLGAEDQVLTHMIATSARDIPVFTLDTGRLYQESYDLLERTRARYDLEISVYFPDSTATEEMVRANGPNLFYESVDNRKLCCRIRKVEPLTRALRGLDAWLVGLRSEQSVTRRDLQPIEWDQANGLVKIAPLARWTEADVWDFIRKNQIPYHPLHDHGYRSIGCAPCTRAVEPGQDARAGRWWWEDPEHKECGLHSDNGLRTADPESQTRARFGIGTVTTD